MQRYHNKRFFKRTNTTDNNNNNNNNTTTFCGNKYYGNSNYNQTKNNHNNAKNVNNNNGNHIRVNKIENNASISSGSHVKILQPSKHNKELTENDKQIKQEMAITDEDNDVVKHPLEYRWQLWYQRPSRDKKYDWQNNLIAVIDFETIEEFWQIYLHIQSPNNLTPGSDYSVFKCGIKPMWEDVRNKSGGRWLVTIHKNKDRSMDASAIEQLWSEVLMCLIGEAFGDDGQHVCGAVFNTRQKYDRISVWTDDASDKSGNDRIGQILNQRTNNALFYYETHFDSQTKTAYNTANNYNTV